MCVLCFFSSRRRQTRCALVTGVQTCALPILLRRGLPELVARLAAIDGIEDLALTTNGSLLSRHAKALAEAGLHRLTVSLDTLNPERFARLSGGRGRLDEIGRAHV